MDKDLEQYRLAVETAEKTTDRRYNFNKFIITILTALLAAIAAMTKGEYNNLWLVLPLCIAGFCICIVWIRQIKYFKKMIKIKYSTLKAMENEYNIFKTYCKEDEQREGYKEKNDFKSFSEQEKLIAIIFLICFALYIFGLLLNLIFGINNLNFFY